MGRRRNDHSVARTVHLRRRTATSGLPQSSALLPPWQSLRRCARPPVPGEAAEDAGAADEGRSVASHIPAAVADPVRPVTVIDRTDIALSGMRTVSDLLESRVSYNSFGLGRPFVLGDDRAAVLINGRRISDSTLDLATLPTSAVERVEILNGGAPALHGGHAIAGAVNIVLRRGYEGAEASAYAGGPTDAGGDSEQGSALWGGAVGQGRVTIGVDVFRREEIPDAAREHSRARWTPGGLFADATGISAGGNTVYIATRTYDENDPTIVHRHPRSHRRRKGPLDCTHPRRLSHQHLHRRAQQTPWR